LPFHPVTDLVAVAFLRTVPELDSALVSTTLPKNADAWADGYVQIVGIGGIPGIYVPLHASIVNVSCWAANMVSGKPPWGKANQLAEHIKAECLNHSAFPKTLSLASFGDYASARLHTAFFVAGPRRIPSDEGSYARYDGDLQLNWTPLI
jgi:hypothetical protein